MPLQIDLAGRIVLVTGASRGIGRAIALAMADAGASVAVHYDRSARMAEDVATQTGGRSFQADLSDPAACERLIAGVVDAYGRLDVLVNNAGIAEGVPLDADVATVQATWDRTMAVNARAPELLFRLALPAFRAQGGGRVINIASRAAFRGDTPEYMVYGSSKAAMVAATRTIARFFGKEGIRAFTIAPGFTRTDMAAAFIAEYGEAIALGDIALERLTEPEDLAPLAVLLASGLADHATGSTIDVNAGSYVR
jgi:3-oxoacyl-[acyl-carrier protein] reductase